ncbi:glycosyltransferase family 4 protein [Actinophytocola algeriensis]|uniref:UDP-GlcNAc:undecaprenyl-phosphate GlcNAc-1-phosphate transferase n=1 Tax=Actinophytocola algeriensis TaxID=1768010 RepID=A0A7W7Q6Z3_9PSEU|nr:MraY family glycosyltransferase [Actinophytocola algeriensis]MBB4908013.1 UDP-GlcNAc:undecaprenyl-phosphate GlcNAc-1-phosphate transferase [Actinophytocola algeriensis]MBE1480043.1 UDP-GlcNAc:undecaprenyl-phosphate GlcNAc-1-phosphate transferase [Actinophytocola algeriensis]
MDLAQNFQPAGLPIREYLLVGLTTAVLTFLFTGLVRRLALRWGAVAYPRQRDVHTVPIPRLGGLAMYLGVCGGMLLAHQLPVLRRAFDYSLDPTAILLGGGLIMVIGMLDDRFELDSLTKLAGQTTCAGILVLLGLQWIIFWVPWGGNGSGGSLLILDQNQGAILTVLLVVTMVNAINFVDGLDGLAAGVGLISSVATCAFSLHLLDQSGGDVTYYPPALIAATLAGACLGFLPHNFQPAKIFMGDSGSMLIGLMMAAASTSASGKVQSLDGTETIALLSPLLVVAAVLFVPVLDLLMAIVRRTRKGLSPFHADKMHLHHRLLEIGHSQRRAVLLIYLWAAVLAFGTVALSLFDVFAVVWGIGIGLLIALVVSIVPRLRAR